MSVALIGFIGVVLGWGVHELSRFVYYRKEQRERRLGVYQQAFAHIKRLQDRLTNITNYSQQVQPDIDGLRQWWYENGLFLDRQTNEAIVGVVNTIATASLPQLANQPQQQPVNMLAFQNVMEAFDRAENAVRSAAGEERFTGHECRPYDRLLRDYVTSNMLTYFFFGLLSVLAFLLSSSRSMPVISIEGISNTVIGVLRWLLTWALVPVGAVAVLWFIVLLIVVLRWNVLERVEEPRFQCLRRWNDLFYWPALVTVFAASFATILAALINAGMIEPIIHTIFGLWILAMVGLLGHRMRSAR